MNDRFNCEINLIKKEAEENKRNYESEKIKSQNAHLIDMYNMQIAHQNKILLNNQYHQIRMNNLELDHQMKMRDINNNFN